uniref:J domain-containing protein n=1 Tax=Rhabditophanes sp. KR3021 TaxID=114890 RepID=A0AC35UCN1_9BILA
MKTKNFYQCLGIQKTATKEEIKKAYKKKALRYHPDKNRDPSAEAKFKEIAEAYEILNDEVKRKNHDKTHEPEASFGFYDTFGAGPSNMFYGNSNCFWNEDSYKSNFNRYNFERFYEASDRHFQSSYRKKRKDNDIETVLTLTLEEFYKGTTKKMKLTKNILERDGTSRRESQLMDIKIDPGRHVGSKITFANYGDQRPDILPADLVFILKEEPHLTLTRKGDDLIYHRSVTLAEALTGISFFIKLLSGKLEEVNISQVIKPGHTEIIVGKGMPIYRTKLYGDLIIEFTIVFPNKIVECRKNELRKNLVESCVE